MLVFPVRHEALRAIDRPHRRLRIISGVKGLVERGICRFRGTLDACKMMHDQRSGVRDLRSTLEISLTKGRHTLLHAYKYKIGGRSRGGGDLVVEDVVLNSSDGWVTRLREGTIL